MSLSNMAYLLNLLAPYPYSRRHTTTMYWLPKLYEEKSFTFRFKTVSMKCYSRNKSLFLNAKQLVINVNNKFNEHGRVNQFWSLSDSVDVLNTCHFLRFKSDSLTTIIYPSCIPLYHITLSKTRFNI